MCFTCTGSGESSSWERRIPTKSPSEVHAKNKHPAWGWAHRALRGERPTKANRSLDLFLHRDALPCSGRPASGLVPTWKADYEAVSHPVWPGQVNPASCFNLALLFIKLHCALNPSVPRARSQRGEAQSIAWELPHRLQHEAMRHPTSLGGNLVFCAQPWLQKEPGPHPGTHANQQGAPVPLASSFRPQKCCWATPGSVDRVAKLLHQFPGSITSSNLLLLGARIWPSRWLAGG